MSVPPAGDAMEPGAAELYDQALLGILQHVGNVQDFLRVLFGFLYRKTDFYRLLRHPSDRMGFPPGAAQALVLQVTRGGQAAPGGVGGAVAARPRRPPARPPPPASRVPVALEPRGSRRAPRAAALCAPGLRSSSGARTRLLGPRLHPGGGWNIRLLLRERG